MNKLLNGLSRSTILGLKYSDDEGVRISNAYDPDKKKYLGWILTLEGRPILNSPADFESSTEAEEYMKNVVAAARESELE